MRKLFIISLLSLSLAANAGKGNKNGNGNGGNGNHNGWIDNSDDEDQNNPGEVGGDPDEGSDTTNVPIDDYIPVLIAGAVGYGFWMNRKRKLQIN
jgi:hypothetical protein